MNLIFIFYLIFRELIFGGLIFRREFVLQSRGLIFSGVKFRRAYIQDFMVYELEASAFSGYIK